MLLVAYNQVPTALQCHVNVCKMHTSQTTHCLWCRLSRCGAHSLSNLLWACAVSGIRDPGFLLAAQDVVVARKAELKHQVILLETPLLMYASHAWPLFVLHRCCSILACGSDMACTTHAGAFA